MQTLNLGCPKIDSASLSCNVGSIHINTWIIITSPDLLDPPHGRDPLT